MALRQSQFCLKEFNQNDVFLFFEKLQKKLGKRQNKYCRRSFSITQSVAVGAGSWKKKTDKNGFFSKLLTENFHLGRSILKSQHFHMT